MTVSAAGVLLTTGTPFVEPDLVTGDTFASLTEVPAAPVGLNANTIHETLHVVGALSPIIVTAGTVHFVAHVVPAFAPVGTVANTIHEVLHVVGAFAPIKVTAGTIHEALHVISAQAPVFAIPGGATEFQGFIPITVRTIPSAPHPLVLVAATFDATDYSTDTGAKTYVTAPVGSNHFVRFHDNGAGTFDVRLGTFNATTGATSYGVLSGNPYPVPGVMPYCDSLSMALNDTHKTTIFYPVSGAWTLRFYSVHLDGSINTYTSSVLETTSFTSSGVGTPHMGLARPGSDGRDGNDYWYVFHPRSSGSGRVQRSDSSLFFGGVLDRATSTAVGTVTKDSPTHYAWITKDRQRGVVAFRDFDVPNEITMSHFYREDDRFFPSPDTVVPYSISDDNWGMASFNQSPALVVVPNTSTSIKVKQVNYSTTEDDSVFTLATETVLNLGWTATGTVIPSISTLDDSNILIMAMGTVSAASPTQQRLSMWVASRASNGTVSFSSRLDKDYVTGATFGPTLGQAHAHLVADKWALVSVAAPKANLLIVELQRT